MQELDEFMENEMSAKSDVEHHHEMVREYRSIFFHFLADNDEDQHDARAKWERHERALDDAEDRLEDAREDVDEVIYWLERRFWKKEKPGE